MSVTKLGFFLILLVNYVYSQCTSGGVMDIVFGIDGSGYVSDNNFDGLKLIVKQIIGNDIPFSNGVSKIGFITFDSKVSITPLTTYTSVSNAITAVDSVIRPIGGNNQTRSTSEMIKNATIMFANDEHEKVLIILTSGNALIDESNTLKPVDVCPSGMILRRNGVNIVTIGIGSTLTSDNTFSYLHDCLNKQTNKEPYIINDFTVSAFSSIETRLKNSDLCLSYNLKITEVKPTQVGSEARFIEIFNIGADFDLSTLQVSGLFSGFSSTSTLTQGQYLVIYETGGTQPTCVGCNVIYATATVNTAATITSWSVTITDGTNTIDTIDGSTLFTNLAGHSFQLSYITFSNKADNWESSCDTTGTPGTTTDTCTTQPSCTSASCVSSQGGSCQNNACTCGTGYYTTTAKPYYCKLIGTISSCNAYQFKDPYNGQKQMRLIWKTNSATDQDHSTRITYYDANTNQKEAVRTGSASLTNIDESDFDFNSPDIANGYGGQVNYNYGNNQNGDKTNCIYITESPTPSPTNQPTLTPSVTPTHVPTISPTISAPWFYLTGTFCTPERCMCNVAFLNKYCCDDITNPSNISVWGCATPTPLVITLKNNTQYEVTVKKALEFPYRTTIRYEITHLYQCTFGSFNTLDNTCNVNGRVYNNTDGVIFTAESGDLDTDIIGGTIYMNSSNEFRIGMTFREDYNYTQYIGQYFDGFYQYYSLNIYECRIIDQLYDIATYGDCKISYPSNILIVTSYGNIPSGTIRNAKEIPKWLWWVLLLIALFLCCIAMIIWKYCWKNRANTKTLNEQKKELLDVEQENELGFGNDLDPGNVNFNRLNPNVNGFNNIAPTKVVNPGPKKYGRIDEIAKIDADKFEERQQFGQSKGASAYQPPSNL